MPKLDTPKGTATLEPCNLGSNPPFYKTIYATRALFTFIFLSMAFKIAAVAALIVLLFAGGVYWFATHQPNSYRSPTWPEGTAVQVPVIAFDQGNGGNPVAGVRFTVSLVPAPGETPPIIGSVLTTAGVIPPNITLVAGQLYTFQVSAYGATKSVNMVMSDVKGADIVIMVNSLTQNITEIEFTFPIY